MPGSPDPAVRTATKAAPGLTQGERPDLAVEARDVSSEGGRPILLKVSVRQTGDVTVEGIRLVGLPPGLVISDLVHIVKSIDSDDIVDLTDWSLADLRLIQPEKPIPRFKLTFSVIWKPRHSDSIEVSSAEFTARTATRPGGADRPVSEAVGPDAKAPEPPRRDTSDMALPRRSPPSSPLPAATPPRSDGIAMPGPVARADVNRERVEVRIPAAADIRVRPPSPVPSGTAPAPPIEAGSLVERAKGLIKRGDISGARLFLERARARNEPEATFLLAQTWDPEMLRRWNVLGLRPDPERAQALYAEAAERGRTGDQKLSTTRP